MCLPKFTHVSTVILSLLITKIKEIEREFSRFINDNKPSVMYKTTRYMPRREGGLGMIRIGNSGDL